MFGILCALYDHIGHTETSQNYVGCGEETAFCVAVLTLYLRHIGTLVQSVVKAVN